MTDQTIPVVFGIDVEPDDPEFEPGSRAPWAGFEACLELLAPVRDRMERATGRPVHFSWFLRMDPQIEHGYGSATWVAEAYAAQLEHLRRRGDELGLHSHAWRWDGQSGRWRADIDNDAWVASCARSSFDAYREAFGTGCHAHRSGDRFMSNSLLQTLRELRVEVDLTPEPGMRGLGVGPSRPHTAPIPDQALVPRIPYVPSAADWRRPAPGGDPAADLLMIPLTASDPGPSMARWRRSARWVRNLRRPLHRPLLPWAPALGSTLWDIVAADIRGGSLSTLAFAMRSHAALEDEARNALLASFAALERHELARTLSFVTPSAVRNAIVAAGPLLPARSS